MWTLGFVSLLMDASSELVHAVIPLFLTAGLGASMAVIGLIEGLAEATAPLVKALSGRWSDRMHRRKPLVLTGYSIAALTKPVFALAGSIWLIATARIADRIGKGIRGAPRDALIADVTPEAQRGAAFGLRQSLDTIGAIIGPLAAVAILWASLNDFRLALWAAVLPAALSVFVIIALVEEPARPKPEGAVRREVRFRDLPRGVWTAIGIGTLVCTARYSDAFLILHAADHGFGLAFAPLVIVAMNLVYTLTAWPAGRALDRHGPDGLLGAGLVALILSNLALTYLPGVPGALLGTGFFGLHMGLTQGVLSAMIGRAAPEALRGTAFGAFHGMTGLGLLAASAGGGALWTAFGAHTMFLASAGVAALTLAALGLTRGHRSVTRAP